MNLVNASSQFSGCYVLLQSDDVGNDGKVDGQTPPDNLKVPSAQSRSYLKPEGNMD